MNDGGQAYLVISFVHERAGSFLFPLVLPIALPTPGMKVRPSVLRYAAPGLALAAQAGTDRVTLKPQVLRLLSPREFPFRQRCLDPAVCERWSACNSGFGE